MDDNPILYYDPSGLVTIPPVSRGSIWLPNLLGGVGAIRVSWTINITEHFLSQVKVQCPCGFGEGTQYYGHIAGYAEISAKVTGGYFKLFHEVIGRISNNALDIGVGAKWEGIATTRAAFSFDIDANALPFIGGCPWSKLRGAATGTLCSDVELNGEATGDAWASAVFMQKGYSTGGSVSGSVKFAGRVCVSASLAGISVSTSNWRLVDYSVTAKVWAKWFDPINGQQSWDKSFDILTKS